jgi:hypothetical protein
MRAWLTLFALAAASAAHAAPAGHVVAGEDLCQVNRGQDQLKMRPGVELAEGDVIKCIGRTRAKAFVGDTLVLFGPLSETKIAAAQPVQLELAKGAVRVMTRASGAASVKTPKALVALKSADAFVRYNAASEFSEVVAIEGSVAAENIGMGAVGNVALNPMESSLLSPESAPSSPTPLSEGDLRTYTRETEYAEAPLPGGDLMRGIEPTLARIDQAYDEARRKFARPSLPQNAPFRALDSRRQAFVAPQFDQPARESAPAGATLDVKYSFPKPELRPKP